MADSFIRSSGNEVFAGAQIGLNSKEVTWDFDRLTKAPTLPANWKPAEIDSVGFKNPTLKIRGLIDGTKTHSENETDSKIDFNFLNELVSSSGLKYFADDFYKPVTGSEFLVEIDKIQIPQVAKQQEMPNIRSNSTPYTLNLIVASGTPWWSGTGILE